MRSAEAAEEGRNDVRSRGCVNRSGEKLRSGHCKGRFIKHNFDDFDDSDDNINGGASDRERRAKAKYKNKADKRVAKLEAMIEEKIRVKTEEKKSLRKKDKA